MVLSFNMLLVMGMMRLYWQFCVCFSHEMPHTVMYSFSFLCSELCSACKLNKVQDKIEKVNEWDYFGCKYSPVPMMLNQVLFPYLHPLLGSRSFLFPSHFPPFHLISIHISFTLLLPFLSLLLRTTARLHLYFSSFMLAAHCSTTGCNVFQIPEWFFIHTEDNSTGLALQQ